jgi:Ca-activated chloride channel family protein
MMSEQQTISKRSKRAFGLFAVLFTMTFALGAALHARTQSGHESGVTTVEAGDGTVSIHGTLDRTAVLMGEDGLVRMELLLEGHATGDVVVQQLPTDLVVILDRSGSMNGRKIADARAAVHHLIERLGPEDRFALVPFSSDAHTAIPLSYATAGARANWRRVVDGVHAGGGTFMATGLRLGLGMIETARAVNRAPRVILISDGLAAEPHSELLQEAARAARGEFSLSAVGVGADFDEVLMSGLADAGTGNYYFLNDARELAAVFANEFETARETVASGVTVVIEPSAGVTVVDAAGYPLDHSGGNATFRPGTLFQNQQRRIWVTFRVPTQDVATHPLGAVRVQYSAGGERHRLRLAELPAIETVADRDAFFAAVDVDTWAESVAVEEYNELRQSVAGYVKAGRSEAARKAIAEFGTRNRAMNAAVPAPSPMVADRLLAAEALEDEVDAAFRGVDQAKKQNLLGKTLHQQGNLERRAGSRK